MSPLATKPPKTELGSESGYAGGLMSWALMSGGEDIENVVELQWPNSAETYRKMMNDAQCNSLYLGTTLPIRSYRWFLEPNGAPPAAVERLSKDYNLPIGRESIDEFKRRRGARRFSFVKHLEDALRALYYGYMFFEQVGDISNADGFWHLQKLGIRPPRTLSEIKVAPDGGLDSIRQLSGPMAPPIPVSRLVAYVWDREGANWVGRSMLRSIYRNHIIKDRVLRVGAINIERAGGVPYVEAPEGATGTQIRELDNLARSFRVGEAAGAALPHGAQLKFAAAAGGDGAVNFIKLQNEEMARSWLQMIQVLGQTQTGSRALGSEFNDIAATAQTAIARWFCDIFNEHVIEDDVEWNEGPLAEFAPLINFETGAVDPLEAMNQSVGADDGLMVQPGGTVARMLYAPRRPSRPRAARTTTPPAPSLGSEPRAERQQRAGLGAVGLPLPARSLRRQPYEHELRAAVDFNELDAAHASALFLLETEVRTLQAYQIDQLHDAIVDAGGDLEALMEIVADPIHADVIAAQLSRVSASAITQAVQEASRQGVSVSPPGTSALAANVKARAEAVDNLLTRNLAQSAARQALRLTGGGLSAVEVADQTRDYLRSLSGSYLQDVLGGAVQQSINAGRKLVFKRDGAEGDLYSSELLDAATCSRCIAVDGRHYADIEEAERDYPTGGYFDCEGRERCRGTLVKVYKTEVAPTLQEPFGG